VVGENTIVALEQADGTVVMEAVPASSGSFVFCPVADGVYNLIAVAIDGSGNTYAATAITGVKAGDSLGTVPLTPAGSPASISGQITTDTGTAGTAPPPISLYQPYNRLATARLSQFLWRSSRPLLPR
jgi:hypothetical protein